VQIVLGIVIGVLLGALGVWVVFASRSGARRAELSGARSQLDAVGAERDALRSERDEIQRQVASLEATNVSLAASRAEEQARLAETIAALTNEVVAQGTARLTELAAERFEIVTSSLEQNEALRDERFRRQVDPLRELLDRYTLSVNELEAKREGAYKEVTIHLEQLKASEARLQKETQSLVTALRSPSTRGRWGELQLRRVVEMAGMVEHCDFVEQGSVSTDDGIQRPDLLVTLPDGAQVVIDAKVPLDAYLRAIEAEDEETRRLHLQDHARQLRSHVDSLAKKAYWKQFEPASPEFVVCFVPGESLLAAAFEADPTLIDRAMDNKVLLTGPVNLIALLKTVGLGWRQEQLATNAAEIQEAGQELYERLVTFASHLSKVGRSLNSSLNAYNDAVGSLERRVLPSARRFERLGVTPEGGADLEAPTPVDGAARRLEAPELSGPDHPAGAHAELHLVESDEEPLEP
jgi:DNA recombination protein RmuC